MALWCSRLARQPVTLEVDGSSPFGVAKKRTHPKRDEFFFCSRTDSKNKMHQPGGLMPDAGSTASAPYKFVKRICASPFGVAGSRYTLRGGTRSRLARIGSTQIRRANLHESVRGSPQISAETVGDGFQPSRNVTPSAAACPSGQLPKRYGSGGLKSLPYRRIRDIPSRKHKYLPDRFPGRRSPYCPRSEDQDICPGMDRYLQNGEKSV